MINTIKDIKLGIIGLGYVGLPLALEFSKNRKVIGFDLKKNRIEELNSGIDKNLESSKEEIQNSKQLNFTNNVEDLKYANCFIVTVPTPINELKKPDLQPLLRASEMIGKIIKEGDLIIYESTVYPGCTEEVRVAILEKFSNLQFNKNFFCGYSPERINPGDKEHTISNVKKITSGSTPEIGKAVDDLYRSIITAGTHLAPTLKVAEASKVIENAQRDVNIAFVNELAIIFNKLGIDTHDVLKAAATKWNFLYFKPGLVGGHCIGVDPFYLAQKAQEVGYHSEIILAGRRLNDSMGEYVATEILKLMVLSDITVKKAKVLMLGITFKENCPDIRNSKVFDLVEAFPSDHYEIHVYDPWVNRANFLGQSNITLIDELTEYYYHGIILAVPHDCLVELGVEEIKRKGQDGALFFDLKSAFDKKSSDFRF